MILQNFNSGFDESRYPESLQKALKYLRTTDFSSLADGEYEIEGRNIYAKVFNTESKLSQDTHAEYHKDYIDVQYWLSGEELMGYAPMPSDADYRLYSASEEDDLYLLSDVPENEIFIPCKTGDYIILFPEDIHRPTVAKGNKIIKYRKVVIKVRVSTL